MDIQHKQGDSKGRYEVSDPEGGQAYMTYSRAGDTLIIIDHTEVPEALRGKGYGEALVERAVKDARAVGSKIVPLCPFAAAQFRRHAAWHDVLS